MAKTDTKEKPKDKAAVETVTIAPANMTRITLRIRSTAPYVQEAFSQKVRDRILTDMETPKAEKKGKGARPVRNYDDEFVEAQHIAVGGWNGIPCNAIRGAMVRACAAANVVMTRAKMAIFPQPDGFSERDGTALVRLHGAGPERTKHPVRNDNGSVDIRVRPMWREWYADVQIEFDADMIDVASVVNLLDRAGRQVGIGAGRPFSKKSVGMGWGTFTVDTERSAVA